MQTTYTTKEAIELLKQGKKIIHEEWVGENISYCQLDFTDNKVKQSGYVFLRSSDNLSSYYDDNSRWLIVDDNFSTPDKDYVVVVGYQGDDQ